MPTLGGLAHKRKSGPFTARHGTRARVSSTSAAPAVDAMHSTCDALPRHTWLDGACACAAWALPVLACAASVSGAPVWSSDAARLRDVGFVAPAFEGILSSAACQLAVLVPLGDRSLRAALVGAFALALCSRLLFSLCRDALERAAAYRFGAPLALLASQLWAQSPRVQAELCRVGGPGVALLVSLM